MFRNITLLTPPSCERHFVFFVNKCPLLLLNPMWHLQGVFLSVFCKKFFLLFLESCVTFSGFFFFFFFGGGGGSFTGWIRNEFWKLILRSLMFFQSNSWKKKMVLSFFKFFLLLPLLIFLLETIPIACSLKATWIPTETTRTTAISWHLHVWEGLLRRPCDSVSSSSGGVKGEVIFWSFTAKQSCKHSPKQLR